MVVRVVCAKHFNHGWMSMEVRLAAYMVSYSIHPPLSFLKNREMINA